MGGTIVVAGSPDQVISHPGSLTGRYLAGELQIELPAERQALESQRVLSVRGACGNNLQHLDIDIPVGLFTCVTGVSGSGKSTLVNHTIFPAMAKKLHQARHRCAPFKTINGFEYFDKVIDIDQTPIGRTPRSNPATYSGVFAPIRSLFAKVIEARKRGYPPGRFSFNVKGGRCEACQGDGTIRMEMHFLPDLYIRCGECRGKRFNRETLDVRYKGRTIADVLDMTVDQALEIFSGFPRIRPKLETLRDVGLGYIRLGQPATTLSGGEAQRVKLSTELSKRATGKTLYLLDEPTTGLSFEDCAALLRVLHRLVDGGNTVILIEHNLDVIKNADWIIDLGPGAGDLGGRLIAQGTPEQVAKNKKSFTGQYLQPILKNGRKTVGEPVGAAVGD